MRVINKAVVSALLMAAAVPASAVTWVASNGAPDPGKAADQFTIATFDAPILAGYSLSGNYSIVSGSTTAAAAPAGDLTQYLYTSPSIPNGVATLSTLDLSSISFYWGSIDDYNSVEVLGLDGVVLATIGGVDVAPATGNQESGFDNKRIFISASGSERITGLRFTATGIAFEIDDVAGKLYTDENPSIVPEPATWALMIGGFAMVGLGARRQRKARRVAV